jgi:hypothetical protein
MATPDNGLCAALYSASEVQARAGDGTAVRITEETRYPFEDTIQFRVQADKPVRFPLYLRLPAWCQAPAVSVNGKSAKLSPGTGKFARLEREWKTGDRVILRLPMQVSVRTWTRNHNSVSVDYGPLTFSLKIGERYDRIDSTRSAIGDSNWQKGADPSKWPAYEIHPTTPWNYGLLLKAKSPSTSFQVQHRKWPADDFPFTQEGAPIVLKAKARRIPEWTLDRYGLCAVLQDSPVRSDEPVETVSLIPMGAARLRISAFPVIGEGPDAKRWVAPAVPKPPLYKVTASHCFRGDTLEALCDGLEPANSADHGLPRFTWWDHRGTSEWVQYEFPQPRQVSGANVYWFDDTGAGQCRIPKSWRVLCRQGNDWKTVATLSGATRDQWNRANFPEVTTSAVRIEADLQSGFSGGILEWQVK